MNLLLSFISLISYLGIYVSVIWAIVSFIIYLVKDIAFNWWSICVIIVCIVILILSIGIKHYLDYKGRRNGILKSTSRFQQKVNELMEKNKTK